MAREGERSPVRKVARSLTKTLSSKSDGLSLFKSLGDVDVERLRINLDRVEKQALIGRAGKRKRLIGLRVLLYLGAIFALQFVAFASSPVTVELFGAPRGSTELVAISFGLALAIWAGMLLPAVASALNRPSKVKRLADKLARQREAAFGAPSEPDEASGRSSWDPRLLRSARSRARPASAARTALWRGLRLATQLLDTPNYWVSRLCRLGFYCLCYVWSTYYLRERDECGQWDWSAMPRGVLVVNAVSLWTTFLDYALEVLSNGWAHVLTMGSFVELITQPPAILLVTGLLRSLNDLSLSGERVPPCGEPGHAESLGALWQLDRLSAEPHLFLLQFGWLRFLSAHRVNALTLKKLHVRSVRVRIASLALAVACIFLVIAGSMFTLEARLNGDETFANFFDFFYFAVVTGSTVGYGDFSPSTPLSRLICISAIVITITWIPEQVGQLQTAFSERLTAWGQPPGAEEPFVLLCGYVTPWQLRIFLRNYERQLRDEYHRPPEKIVVLSTLPLEAYELGALPRHSAARLYAYEGDVLTSTELGTKDAPLVLRNATRAFVYCGSVGRVENDSHGVLRVLALLNFVPPWAVTCLLARTATLAVAANIGVHEVLCTNDLQMRFLAKSITDAPGVLCLVSNLLISGKEFGQDDRNRAWALEDSSDEEDAAGAAGVSVAAARRSSMRARADLTAHKLRRMSGVYAPAGGAKRAPAAGGSSHHQQQQPQQKPKHGQQPPAHGQQGQQGQQGQHHQRHSFSLGAEPHHAGSHAAVRRSSTTQQRQLHRDDMTMASHRALGVDGRDAWRAFSTERDHGEYLLGAESQLLVHSLPAWALGRRAQWLYERLVGVDGIQLLGLRSGDDMLIWRGDLSLRAGMEGVWMARSDRALARFVASAAPPPEPDIPVARAGARFGGAPAGGASPGAGRAAGLPGGEVSGTELRSLQRGERIVILGAPDDLDVLLGSVLDSTRVMAHFVHVVHVAALPSFRGLPKLLARHGGHSKARPGVPRYVYVHADALEHETLKEHILAPGLHSVLIFPQGLADGGEQRMDAVVAATMVEAMLPYPNRVRVLVSLSSTQDMRFVERSSWWPRSDDAVAGHLSAPTYSTGAVFADEMLYPLMMGWAKEGLIAFLRALTDELIDPVQLKLFELPPELKARALPMPEPARPPGVPPDPASAEAEAAGARAGGRAPPPAGAPSLGPFGARRGTSTLTYEELCAHLLAHGLLPLGLYRWRNQTSQDKVLRVLPFVFTNPPNDTRVRSTDRVYALCHDRERGAERAAAAAPAPRVHSARQVDDAARTIQRRLRRRRQTRWAQWRHAHLVKHGLVPDRAASGSLLGRLRRLGGGGGGGGGGHV